MFAPFKIGSDAFYIISNDLLLHGNPLKVCVKSFNCLDFFINFIYISNDIGSTCITEGLSTLNNLRGLYFSNNLIEKIISLS